MATVRSSRVLHLCDQPPRSLFQGISAPRKEFAVMYCPISPFASQACLCTKQLSKATKCTEVLMPPTCGWASPARRLGFKHLLVCNLFGVNYCVRCCACDAHVHLLRFRDVFTDILTRCDIVTTPGSGFGPGGEGFVRASAFGSRDNINEAVRRFKAAFSK
eukprot:281034-Pelagomonas_calceolata.AAC.1